MWSVETRWFDVAVFLGLFTIGSILFGRFEEHKAAWRRLLKVPIFLAILLALITAAGRPWAYGVFMLLGFSVGSYHFWWLHRHGINGWTGEPRDKYVELVKKVRERSRR
jgi:hypothetical protein